MNAYNKNKAKCAIALKRTKMVVSKLRPFQGKSSRQDSIQRPASVVVRRRLAIENAYMLSFAKTNCPSYKIGLGAHLNSAGEIEITVRQNEHLSEALKGDIFTNVYLTVSVCSENRETAQDVCLVRKGKEEEIATLKFKPATSQILETTGLKLKLYFVTGRFFKRKDIICKWSVNLNLKKHNNMAWKSIKQLSGPSDGLLGT